MRSTASGGDGAIRRQPQRQPQPAAAAPTLPAGWPKDLRINRVAKVLQQVILEQNPGMTAEDFRAESLLCVDWDLTTAATVTPVLLKHLKTGEPFIHPATGTALQLGVGQHRDADHELLLLREKHPELPWEDYAPDFAGAFEGREAFLQSAPIEPTLQKLDAANRDPKARTFVVTARQNVYPVGLIPAMYTYLHQRGTTVDGILAPNSAELRARIPELDDEALSYSQRKAIVLVALLHLYGAERQHFVDDSASNLRAAMESVPALRPDVELHVDDVIHEHGSFFLEHVASSPPGLPCLIGPSGEHLSTRAASAYQSRGTPFECDPVLASLLGA